METFKRLLRVSCHVHFVTVRTACVFASVTSDLELGNDPPPSRLYGAFTLHIASKPQVVGLDWITCELGAGQPLRDLEVLAG
jgi:hypothetical protein